jgi:pyruvate/2-oxoglutarate dehydrogenase complex dihydrolipoamide dehydrogenase (E3) component
VNHFDVVIIGGGQAGIPLAHGLAKAGKTVALAERKFLGGSCVNFGCTPTKAAIASAKLAHQARRASEYGLRIPKVEVDFAGVLERAKRIALNSRHGHDKSLEHAENPKLLRGHARLEGRADGLFQVRVGDQRVSAKQVVLNTGTRSFIPPISGLMDVDVIHAGNWLEMPMLPTHLAVIGGGYIGLEMAQFYARMGSDVTVLHMGTQVADHEDEDVAQTLQTLLEREGIQFQIGVNVKRTEARADGVRVSFERDGTTHELDASHVFVATGRVMNTDDLGLETLGVKLSNRGVVEVDDHLETSVPGIFAAGDIRGGPQFTHTAWDDYRILENQIVGDGLKTTRRVLPYGLFTDPELGRVGMTEHEAIDQGLDVKVAKFELKRNGKALEIGEPDGFIKLVVDAKTDRILGAAVLSSEGAELVHTYVTAMNADAPFTVIRDAVFAHPTLQEAIQSATALIKTSVPPRSSPRDLETARRGS